MKRIEITLPDGTKQTFDKADVTIREIEEPKGNGLVGITKITGKMGYRLIQDGGLGDGFRSTEVFQGDPDDRPRIINYDDAQAFAEALNTWFELAACEGVVRGLSYSAVLYVVENTDGVVWVNNWSSAYCMSRLSPVFGSRESAEGAIEKIGKERLERMFKAFHFCKE